MIEIRFAALSVGPRMVTYGFIAACKNVLAIPQIKEAKRNITKLLASADKMNTPNAIANIAKADAIVRL